MTDRHLPADGSAEGAELLELEALDERATVAARGLRAHVAGHLDVERAVSTLPPPGAHRGVPHRRVLGLAAAVVLVVALVGIATRPGGGEQRIEMDDLARPDLQAGMLTPLGPRDGKDSVQLPLTAEPSTGLRDGDEVRVRGVGFVPGEAVGLVQCAREAGGDSPETRGGAKGCDLGDYTSITADESGVAEGVYAVRRLLTTPLTGSVDCAAEAGRCMVAMGAVNDYDRSGGHAIEFATDVPPVELPTVSVLPAEGLADGQVVRVTADGLAPDELVTVQVCSADPDACWSTGQTMRTDTGGGGYMEEVGLRTDRAGRLDGEVPVWRFLPGPEPGTYVDCAVSRCSLSLSGSSLAPPTVPLHFHGQEPPPSAPAVGAQPSTGVAPGDTIAVAGEGFVPGEELVLSVCVDPVEVSGQGVGIVGCAGDGPSVTADEDGAFTVAYEIPALDGMGTTETCDATGRCQLVEGEDVTCDGIRFACTLRIDPVWYAPGEGGAVAPPIFTAEPITITFR